MERTFCLPTPGLGSLTTRAKLKPIADRHRQSECLTDGLLTASARALRNRRPVSPTQALRLHSIVDGQLEEPGDDTHDRCDCHVCTTLRNVLSANLDAPHDRRVISPLLLTNRQAAELLGIGEDAVRSLITEGELRAVTVQSYGRRRIPRVEIDEYIGRLLTGQLRAWLEARRDLDQWGLRYIGCDTLIWPHLGPE